jgi:pimeloyl-ACP methyl ester carboxylesterase
MTTFARRTEPFRWLAICMGIIGLAGCLNLPDATQPMPTREVRAARGSHQRLLVVLPGRGDDLATLEDSRIAQEVQQSIPDTDVLLVEATMGYYLEGKLIPRLHTEVILPAIQRGYSEVWLAGASMGGLGVLMYEHEYPGALAGLVLMAPYMGPGSLQKEIRTAGGLGAWEPGPKPPLLTRDNVTREEWRVVQSWLTNKARANDVWLICGDEDRLLAAADIVATALPSDHSVRPAGGHRWTVWSPAAADALARAIKGKERDPASPSAASVERTNAETVAASGRWGAADKPN